MRKVRVIITGVGGAMPVLVAALAPTVDCGSDGQFADASGDSPGDKTTQDVTSDLGFPPIDGGPEVTPEAGPCGPNTCQFTVPIPPPGAFPDLAGVCVGGSPVVSNMAATLTLTSFDPQALTADGVVAMKSELLAAIIGDPVINAPFTVSALTKTATGYTFVASALPKFASSMTAKVTFQVGCGDAGLDGGIQTVESTTDFALCLDGPNTNAWESSGSTCIQCCVVCEMAPTPIVSDNHGDDLPLARALRLRVIELARAGKQVVLFAQNDAGPDAEYEWRVSGGSIERLAADVVVWTLPDARDTAPFGQLAVWNDDGAIVENFYWGAA